MSPEKPSPQRISNRLLAALPSEGLERLREKFERVPLALREVLYNPDEPLGHVWFPLDGVVSLVSIMSDGATVETATVGNEGLVGLPVFLGVASLPGQAFVQVPGEALRLPVEDLRREVRDGRPLHSLLNRYTQTLFNQVAQSAACNRLHAIDERCARWLLMTHDRVSSDSFPLTQEFLAQMLGVRRPSVSTAASILQRAGFIRYRRGKITVLDRPGLEGAACECYGVVRREYDRLLGGDAA